MKTPTNMPDLLLCGDCASERLEKLETRLRKYAARHATATVSASDLYQMAAEAILKSDTSDKNDTYLLRLADCRMRNAVNRERAYRARVLDTDIEDAVDGCEMAIAGYTDMPEEVVIQHEIAAKLREIAETLEADDVFIITLLSEGKNKLEIARELGVTRIEYKLKKIRGAFERFGVTPAMLTA